MSEIQLGHTPEQTIAHLRPGHQTIVRLEGGDNRDVFIVDGVEAFRFPKDADGVDVSRYEFHALELVQGKLSVEVPKPIELAVDGSYNVLSFLPGKVLSKYDTAALPSDTRHAMGVAIAGILGELNQVVAEKDLLAISSQRPLRRSRDQHYEAVYRTALWQQNNYAESYIHYFEQLQLMRPTGSANNMIVFGDLSAPNIVLDQDDHVTGLIDWTELGTGDIHNELRPVFSVIGPQAFDALVEALDPALGPVDKDLVRTLAIIHELSVLVSGKQKGSLSPERIQLATESIRQWIAQA